jgi:electron transfer flavoprotein alpha subunit|tara:strand:- start:1518 stop:2498 length:981 start_codon:yes stop_codon:yes gene_type:complete
MAGILVFAEMEDNEALHPNFWELMAACQQVQNEVEGGLQVVVQGHELGSLDDLKKCGANQIYQVEDPKLAELWPDAHLAALTEICLKLQPNLIIMPRTLFGMEVAARLACRLGTGLAQDVVSMKVDRDGLSVKRPVFGGAAKATIRLKKSPWIVVPRQGAFSPKNPVAEPLAELIQIKPEISDAKLKTVCMERVRQKSTTQNLEKAKIIISGGRGLGGPEPFQHLVEIAKLLGASVGSSRPPCDSGWVESSFQIGLTGKTVVPDLYIAIGISGAIQHMTGCSSSQVIVAINKDSEAPIFRMSSFGVVGDWKEVLPAFQDQLAKLIS